MSHRPSLGITALETVGKNQIAIELQECKIGVACRVTLDMPADQDFPAAGAECQGCGEVMVVLTEVECDDGGAGVAEPHIECAVLAQARDRVVGIACFAGC